MANREFVYCLVYQYRRNQSYFIKWEFSCTVHFNKTIHLKLKSKSNLRSMKSLMLFASFITVISCTPKESKNNSMCYEEYLTYISKASGNFDIWINDLSGNETQLTNNPSWDWSPMWNQSLESIIYYSYVDDTFRIRSMNSEGSLIKLDTKGLMEFNLSPDGNTLIMEESRGDNRQLVLVTLDNLKENPITDSLAYYGRAKWSNDSKKVVYISDKDGNNEIYLYDIVSKSTTRLTNNLTNEKYLTWAPDDKRIAFTTEYYEEGQPDRNDVFVMDIESKEATQITNNNYEDSEIAWSPQGGRIAFHSKRDSIDHIYTMKIDGSDVRQVTTQGTYHGEPEWVMIETNCE